MLEGLWRECFDKFIFNGLIDVNGNVTNDMRTRVITWQPILGQYADGGARDTEGQHVVLGFASYEKYFNEIRISGDGYFNARQLMESHPYKKRENNVSGEQTAGCLCKRLLL